MTCTFCGSVLEDNEVECPYCGHKTALAQYSQPVQDEEYEEEYEAEEMEEVPQTGKTVKSAKSGKAKINLPNLPNLPKINMNKVKSSVKEKRSAASAKQSQGGASKLPVSKMNPSFIALIGFVACALLSIICLISVAGVNRKIEEVNQNILSQVYQLQNTNQKISDRLDELGNTVGSVSTTISEASTSRNITITKEPTSAATYLGRGGADDTTQNVPIFSVNATGQNLTFAWQKYDDASSSWVNIVFDADSNNETYGLHVYTDAGKGYSELAAHSVQSSAYGSYRCLVSDNYGNKATETVVLSERDKG
ncbi:MAG: hypothetical protein Q4F31_03845 [Eubacteriales bacterium]|nr:hypothetical protein [Eubacteriales bacterium]